HGNNRPGHRVPRLPGTPPPTPATSTVRARPLPLGSLHVHGNTVFPVRTARDSSAAVPMQCTTKQRTPAPIAGLVPVFGWPPPEAVCDDGYSRSTRSPAVVGEEITRNSTSASDSLTKLVNPSFCMTAWVSLRSTHPTRWDGNAFQPPLF